LGLKIPVMKRFWRKLMRRVVVWGHGTKDVGELAIVYGQAHSGILRLVNLAARQQGPIGLRIGESHGAELQSGAIITTASRRLRIRPPD
jgi:hypothetical protein